MESNELATNEGIDFEIDLEVRDYYSWRSVIGYMIPGRRGTYVNTKFFDSFSDVEVISNFSHEHSHHLGFLHRSGKYLRDSFPYFINKVIKKLYKEIILGNEPEPEPKYITRCRRRWYWPFKKKCYRVRIN